MINLNLKVFDRLRNISFLLFSFSIVSCNSFYSTGYSSSDGIYGEPKNDNVATNQNGTYYKNYFDQKAEQYGLNNKSNDSILTDTNSYTSSVNSSNLTYTDSHGSWGDNPDSINIIYKNYYPDLYW